VRVVVFGGGAIGSFLAARLATVGHSVLLVGRPEHTAAIEQVGLSAEGLTEGSFRFEARSELASAPRPDLVLLTVKSPDLAEAGGILGTTLRPPAPIVLLGNGLGIERRLAESLRAAGWDPPEPWLIRGINSYGVTLLGPGRIRHAGDGEIVLPRAAPPVPDTTIDTVERLLREGRLTVRRAEEFDRELWKKALVNAAINPITADQGLENGALSREPWRGQAERLLREAQRVAAAEGFPIPDDEADRDLWKVVRATARNRSSMLQDLDRGRRTEIDAISGEILLAGTRHGLDLPNTRRAIERVRRREAQGPDRPMRPSVG
jgi:2-dehydropantoate 2-reductase